MTSKLICKKKKKKRIKRAEKWENEDLIIEICPARYYILCFKK
jgi:hypothetical protein